MRKLLQLLGIVEDDEFEAIVSTFQTTIDKLTALIDRKTLVASDASIEGSRILRDAQVAADVLDVKAKAAQAVVEQATITRIKIADLLGPEAIAAVVGTTSPSF